MKTESTVNSKQQWRLWYSAVDISGKEETLNKNYGYCGNYQNKLIP